MGKNETTYHRVDLKVYMEWRLVFIADSYSIAHNMACMVDGVVNATGIELA